MGLSGLFKEYRLLLVLTGQVAAIFALHFRIQLLLFLVVIYLFALAFFRRRAEALLLLVVFLLLMLNYKCGNSCGSSYSTEKPGIITGTVSDIGENGFWFKAGQNNYFFRFSSYQKFLFLVAGCLEKDELNDLLKSNSARVRQLALEIKNCRGLVRYAPVKIKVKKLKDGKIVWGTYTVLPFHESASLPLKLLASLNLRLLTVLEERLGIFEGRLLYGFLTGCQVSSDPLVNTAMYRVGAGHLFAVSGLHFGLLYLIVDKLLSLVRFFTRVKKKILTLLILVFFLIFTGFPESGLRAFVMIFAAELSRLYHRNSNTADVFFFSLAFILAFFPEHLFKPGFQLSCASVAGIIFIFPALKERILKKESFIKEAAVLLFSIQLANLPFQMFYFRRLPLLAASINLLMVPAAPFIMAGGLFELLPDLPLIRSAQFLTSLFLKLLLNVMPLLAHFAAFIPLSSLDLSGPVSEIKVHLGLLILESLFCLSLFLVFKLRQKLLRLGLAFLGIFFVFSGRIFYESGQVIFFDVGQGSSILAVKGNQALLIDAGPPEFNLYERLIRLRLKAPKAVFLTHYHLDHAGGMLKAVLPFRLLPQKPAVYLPEAVTEEEKAVLAVLTACLKKNGVKTAALKNGSYRFGSFLVEVQNVGPRAAYGDENERSAIFFLNIIPDKKRIFCPGDAPSSSFNSLKANDFDVVVASHHGSLTGFSEEFYQGFNGPVIIQVGKNSYRLPDKRVMEYFRENKIAVFNTAEAGTVFYRSCF